MKKNIRLSVFLFLIGILATACNISVEDEFKLASPTCDVDAGNCVSISIKKSDSDTKYINLYRQDVSNSNHPGEIECVGIIYPQALSEETAVNQFKDFLVMKGHSYKYYARLYDGSNYTKTSWSNEVKIPAASQCYNDNTDLAYNTVNANFNIETTTYTMTVEGNVTDPAINNFSTEYKPAIIVKSSNKTQTFLLNSVAEGTVIPLRSILSSYFLDTDITIVGICGQKTETDNSNLEIDPSNRTIRRISWTPSSEIKVHINGTNRNTINIPTAADSTGADYSRQLNKN